jgi:hypothetical protein
LVEVTDTVRERLSDLVQAHSQPKDFTPLFQGGDSPIKNMVIGLNANTDLDALKKASELTEADQAQLITLDKKIAKLKTKNISKQIVDLETTRTDLNGLCDKLNSLSTDLSDAVTKKVHDGIEEFNTADSLAKKIGVNQFKTEFFTQTGTDTWYDFVQAAKSLAEKEQVEDKPYPQDNDRCLFCHQPLSKDARELILKLWEFLGGEAQAAVTKATRDLNTFKLTFNDISLVFLAIRPSLIDI